MGTTAVLAGRETAVGTRQKPKNTARNVFRTVHFVVGLSFGLLLVFQGLSGAALVWRPELDRLMLPSLTHAGSGASSQKQSLDAELAAVKTVAPQGRVRAVRLPLKPGASDEWQVQMPAADGAKGDGPRWTVYTSPATGQVLGRRGPQRDALQFLVELHHNLLWGKTGRTVQGYLAIATMILALSGLWLWWPAKWTPSRFKPRASVRPLHYAVGFWFMWPLLIIATTSSYFIWRQPLQQALGIAEKQPARASESAKPQGEHREGQGGQHKVPSVSLDAIVAAAHMAQPDAKLTMVRFPEGKGGAFTVMFEAADESYRAAPNSISVRMTPDGSAGQIEKVSLWRDQPKAKRFLDWFPRVHQGEWGGPVVRLIWSLTGLMPAVLYVSGFLMWRRRLAVGQ